jgi:uncharacterized protein YbaA (DUF1428 family)
VWTGDVGAGSSLGFYFGVYAQEKENEEASFSWGDFSQIATDAAVISLITPVNEASAVSLKLYSLP